MTDLIVHRRPASFLQWGLAAASLPTGGTGAQYGSSSPGNGKERSWICLAEWPFHFGQLIACEELPCRIRLQRENDRLSWTSPHASWHLCFLLAFPATLDEVAAPPNMDACTAQEPIRAVTQRIRTERPSGGPSTHLAAS